MAAANCRTAGFAFILLLAVLAVILPAVLAGEGQSVNTHIVDFDDFYKGKADQAFVEAQKSYNPNPEEITAEFNKQVAGELQGEHVHAGHKKSKH